MLTPPAPPPFSARPLPRLVSSTPVIVKHRYSEFEQLAAILKDHYVGLIIPALPDKSVANIAQSESYVLSRQSGLNFFCQSIMRNPFLRHDKYWIDFLTPGVKLICADVSGDVSPDANMGLARWHQLIDQTPDVVGESGATADRCDRVDREVCVCGGGCVCVCARVRAW